MLRKMHDHEHRRGKFQRQPANDLGEDLDAPRLASNHNHARHAHDDNSPVFTLDPNSARSQVASRKVA